MAIKTEAGETGWVRDVAELRKVLSLAGTVSVAVTGLPNTGHRLPTTKGAVRAMLKGMPSSTPITAAYTVRATRRWYPSIRHADGTYTEGYYTPSVAYDLTISGAQ